MKEHTPETPAGPAPNADADAAVEDAASAAEPSTLVLSDLHLGQPGRSPDPERFAGLFDGFDRVVINGDAAEVQVPRLRADAARRLMRLNDLCEEVGAELVLIAGNHDAFLSDRRKLTLLGGRVLIVHGDVLHPSVAPWAGGAAEMQRDTLARLAEWGAEHEEAPDADALLEIARHVSHGEFLRLTDRDVVSPLRRLAWWSIHPGRFFAVLNYWRTVPTRAAAFARLAEPAAEVVVFGHSHRAGSWRRRGCHVLNTGSFTWPGKPHAVVVRAGVLSFHAVQKRPEGFVLSDEVLYRHGPAAGPIQR